MSGIWLEYGQPLLSLFLMGLAIKLMDDHLDAQIDLSRGKRTLAVRLNRAALPYAMLLGLLSATLSLPIALAAFLGSYAVGMFSGWRQTLPTRVPAWLEIVIALGLAVLLVGWRTALWGLAMMSVIDWLDDVLDMGSDSDVSQWNLANRIGVVETLLLILIALTAAVLANAKLTALTFIALPFVEMLNQALVQKVESEPFEVQAYRRKEEVRK